MEWYACALASLGLTTTRRQCLLVRARMKPSTVSYSSGSCLSTTHFVMTNVDPIFGSMCCAIPDPCQFLTHAGASTAALDRAHPEPNTPGLHGRVSSWFKRAPSMDPARDASKGIRSDLQVLLRQSSLFANHDVMQRQAAGRRTGKARSEAARLADVSASLSGKGCTGVCTMS